MFKVDLTTLFGITPVNTTPITAPNFKGSEKVGTFNFETEGYKDRYTSNPLSLNKTKGEIEQIAKSNPRIMSLLKEHNLPLRVNMECLQSLTKGHLMTTRVIAAKIYSALPKEMKREANLSDIQQAAMLHDYGKVLVPAEVYNKKGSFTPEEKKIMELHSEFGYELLKQQGINENVLRLVKYHHQKPDGSGYPAVNDDFEYDISAQILAAADKYSALTEDRCYHKAYTKDKALDVIYKDVESGLISQEVFDALKKSIY